MPNNELGDGLSARLRRRRRELGLLQKEASERVECNLWTYSNWEKNRTKPEDRFYPAIIKFLGYDPWKEPMTLPERLIAARLRRGWSQAAAAAAIGVNQKTWLCWEAGVWKPTARTRLIINAILDFDPTTARSSANAQDGFERNAP